MKPLFLIGILMISATHDGLAKGSNESNMQSIRAREAPEALCDEKFGSCIQVASSALSDKKQQEALEKGGEVEANANAWWPMGEASSSPEMNARLYLVPGNREALCGSTAQTGSLEKDWEPMKQ